MRLAAWLEQGLGRAVVFLKQTDARPYRELILRACTHSHSWIAHFLRGSANCETCLDTRIRDKKPDSCRLFGLYTVALRRKTNDTLPTRAGNRNVMPPKHVHSIGLAVINTDKITHIQVALAESASNLGNRRKNERTMSSYVTLRKIAGGGR